MFFCCCCLSSSSPSSKKSKIGFCIERVGFSFVSPTTIVRDPRFCSHVRAQECFLFFSIGLTFLRVSCIAAVLFFSLNAAAFAGSIVANRMRTQIYISFWWTREKPTQEQTGTGTRARDVFNAITNNLPSKYHNSHVPKLASFLTRVPLNHFKSRVSFFFFFHFALAFCSRFFFVFDR